MLTVNQLNQFNQFKTMSKIKVLLVEDSPVAINIYEKMLNSSPHIEVVGKAFNGKEGLDLASQLHPDVICTDLQMPEMDGLEFTKQIMARYPTPILVLSNTVQKSDADTIYEVMKAGVVDVMAKPQTALGGNSESMQNELITKIRVLATKKVSTIPLN
jgi:two-component system, NarL family, response regulator LiaR